MLVCFLIASLQPRTVTYKDSNGKSRTKTEIYWTWDHYRTEHDETDSIQLLGETFPYGIISLPTYRLDLDDVGVKNRMNYIYQNSDIRSYYNVTPLILTGTVFVSMEDNTIHNASALYVDKTPSEVIESKQSAETTGSIVFWMFWIVLTGGCVYGFLYLENRWLD